jgi:hypothetical protein
LIHTGAIQLAKRSSSPDALAAHGRRRISHAHVDWYSERDDWGNLYLYDLASGKMKSQITKGPGNVVTLQRVKEPPTRPVP